jgi:hypothetical protein
MAVAIKETCGGALIARFEDRVLIERTDKLEQRAEIAGRLASAFPGASFEFQLEQLQP